MSEQLPFNLLTGATIEWRGRGGLKLTGEVVAYRSNGDGRTVLQVRTEDSQVLWLFVDVIEQEPGLAFCVLKHTPTTIEYGLRLAEQIMEGKGTHLPVNAEMTTLAATCLALEQELAILSAPHNQEAAK